MNSWGAEPSEWAIAVELLDLGADLLPVVSRPDAKIKTTSSLKSLGKTPSLYSEGQVVGVKDWTRLVATPEQVASWRAEPDYGICLQTRRLRAIDCDIEDAELSDKALSYVRSRLGAVPLRTRGNSHKWLVLIEVADHVAKRIARGDKGAIELLGSGQQCVIAGTHPSGARYVMDWAEGIPRLTTDELDALWAGLAEVCGLEMGRAGRGEDRRRGETIDVEDTTLDHLDILGWGADGQAYISCPFKDEHTSDSGITETAYFKAGSGGYEQGHFKCLHAHCSERTDADFLEALGFMDDLKSVAVSQSSEEVTAEVEYPPLVRDKHGKALATLPNLRLALTSPRVCGCDIGFDTFKDALMIRPAGQDGWREIGDADLVRLRDYLESQHAFKAVGRDLMRDAVLLKADSRRFDSAQLWLEGLSWDGVQRVDGFLEVYAGAGSSEYHTAVSRYLWSALASRVLDPGCKADMVPILQGAQGAGKSSLVAALAPSDETFAEISFAEPEGDLARKCRGRLVIEIGELKGLHSRDLETIKAYVTRRHETWVPKFKEFACTYPRRSIFIGTTNPDEILSDDTGNRRWLPIRAGVCDVGALMRDRDQLWAEAREMARAQGVMWRDAERLGREVVEDFMMRDPWTETVAQWLSDRDFCDETLALTSPIILRQALGYETKHIRKVDERRVGNVMRQLGYIQARKRVGGARAYIWHLL